MIWIDYLNERLDQPLIFYALYCPMYRVGSEDVLITDQPTSENSLPAEQLIATSELVGVYIPNLFRSIL